MNDDLIRKSISNIYAQGGTDSDVEDYLSSKGVSPSDYIKPAITEASLGKIPFVGPIAETMKSIANYAGNAPVLGGIVRPIENATDAAVNYGAEAIKGNFKPSASVKNSAKEAIAGAIEASPMLLSGGGGVLAQILKAAGANFAAQGASSLIRGESAGDSLKNAAIGGLASGGMQGAFSGGGKFLDLIKPTATKTGAVIGGAVSSVGYDDYLHALENAVEGKSVFGKGKGPLGQILGASQQQDDIQANLLADKVLKMANKFRQEIGDQYNPILRPKDPQTGEVLKNGKILDTAPLKEYIGKTIQSFENSDGSNSIRPFANKYFDKLKAVLLQDKMSASRLNDIKSDLQRSFEVSKKEGSGTPDLLNSFYGGIAGRIKDYLNESIPELQKVNKEYGQVKQMSESVYKMLNNDANRGQKLLSAFKKTRGDDSIGGILGNEERQFIPSVDSLKLLSKYAGEKENFTPEINDLLARYSFRPIFPGKGGGSGSAEGAANLARTSLMNKMSASDALKGLWTTFSPVANKMLLQGVSATSKTAQNAAPVLKALAPYLASKTAVKTFGEERNY